MLPIVTPEKMAEIDANSPEPVEVLIDRAARAVAREAVDLMGGTYGRRVTIIAGPGNNGADGRVAAKHLARRGVRTQVIDASTASVALSKVDLVIDAAFGTGLTRPYFPPNLASDQAVLAVDISSGIDGLTGERLGNPWQATRTVTFAALKPGHVLEPGRSLSGEIRLVDIGLDIGTTTCHVVEDHDVAAILPKRSAEAHKWQAGICIIGGSPGMTGAATLAASAAQRAGAGIVQLAMPGAKGTEGPTEAVTIPLPANNWAEAMPQALLDGRIKALLIGPGLGLGHESSIKKMLDVPVPLVLDGDALTAEVLARLGKRTAPTILTPHEGEWLRLNGNVINIHPHHKTAALAKGGETLRVESHEVEELHNAAKLAEIGATLKEEDHEVDKLRNATELTEGSETVQKGGEETARPHHETARPHHKAGAREGGGEVAQWGGGETDRLHHTAEFAKRNKVTVIRKGPSTIVASPEGEVRVITCGTEALASAGTGDVLAGLTTAMLAQGCDPFDAAIIAAHVHALAGRALGTGLIASDLPIAIAKILTTLLQQATSPTHPTK